MVMEQVILENLACRSMPVILPHELIPWLLRHGLHPTIPDHSTIEYWNHIGEPEHSDANPLWIWGDGSQYLESGESITVVCFGMVLQRQLEENHSQALLSHLPLPRRSYPIISIRIFGLGYMHSFFKEVVTESLSIIKTFPCTWFAKELDAGFQTIQAYLAAEP